ncbi:hypothetical protein ACIRRA_41860 [Nocardia sp. NPDC101769]|uniref:hypothetical protein n=1 Tax=Nocardia sp. NPDC101769 TaxID=3364333 RepID=UPI003817211D
MYIEFGFFFVVHAPRQSGKTTALLGLSRELTAEGHFLALCVSCETGEPMGDDYVAVEEALLGQIRQAAELQGWAPELMPPDPWPEASPGTRLNGRSITLLRA